MTTQRRPSWYKPDVKLSVRMLITMFLLGAIYVIFGTVLWSLGVGVIYLAIFAVIIGFIQLFFADKIALASMGARQVDEADAPELHDIIGRLALQTNLPQAEDRHRQLQHPKRLRDGPQQESRGGRRHDGHPEPAQPAGA